MKISLLLISTMFALMSCNNTITKPAASDLNGSSSSNDSSLSSSLVTGISSNSVSNRTVGKIEAALVIKPCLGTFTQDYEVKTAFDNDLFSISKGESFMVESGPEYFGKTSFYKELEEGLVSFELVGELNEIPLEFSCNMSNPQRVFAAFKETVFYADSNLSQEVCTLPSGSVISETDGGYMISNSEENPSLNVYRIQAAHQDESCRGGVFTLADEFFVFNAYYTHGTVGSYVRGDE